MMALLVQIAGALIIALVLAQATMMLVESARRSTFERDRRRLSLEVLRQNVMAAAATTQGETDRVNFGWSGYRKFEISEVVPEADNIASFRLVPHDHRPLPPYRPGQFLTFRFAMKDQPRPVVRCYSLSQWTPEPDEYQITVKRLAAPAKNDTAPEGLVSNHLHRGMHAGDLIDVIAPSGNFTIDPLENSPLVLIAGGIGITPILSMLDAIVETGSKREVWVFYGVRNGLEHLTKERLRDFDLDNENIHVTVAYSSPRPGLDGESDYDLKGHISIDHLKDTLPSSNYDFFICGPPAMMTQVSGDLRKWGVPDDRVHREAFAAASVQGAAAPGVADDKDETPLAVSFERSNRTAKWTGAAGSLLDLAQANTVPIDFGCRVGNCGTCVTAIRTGEVTYLTEPTAEVKAGTCLTCIAIPKTDLVLDA